MKKKMETEDPGMKKEPKEEKEQKEIEKENENWEQGRGSRMEEKEPA